MKERYVAREYARLLLRHAPGECDAVKAFFAAIGKAMAEEETLGSFLCHPAIPQEDKLRALLSIAPSPPSALVQRILADLVKRRVVGLFSAIVEELELLADEAKNITSVSVTSAQELSDAMRSALIERLRVYTRGEVRLRFSVDPTLVSGLLVRIGDTIIDNTVKTDLNRIRQRLLAVSST